MVIDTSILLAIFFNEPHAGWAAEKLDGANDFLIMSTINLAETLIRLQDRQPKLFKDIETKLFSSSIEYIAPSVMHAKLAAQARMKFPINLGDCFAYALAKEENCPLLTLDKDFLKTDCEIIIPRK